jgi:hypothetical protein
LSSTCRCFAFCDSVASMSARYAAFLLAASSLVLRSAPVCAADPPPPAPAPLPSPRPVRLDYQRDPGAERCPKEQAFRDAAGANMITSAPLPVAPPVAKPSPCPVAVVPAVEACQQVTSPPEPPAPIVPPMSSLSPPLPEAPRFQAGFAPVFAIGAAPSVLGGT